VIAICPVEVLSGAQLASPSQSEVGSVESVAKIVVESMDTSPAENVLQSSEGGIDVQSMANISMAVDAAAPNQSTEPMIVTPLIAADIVVQQPPSVADENALPSTAVITQDESVAATPHPDASQEETALAAVVTAQLPQPVSTCARLKDAHTHLCRLKRYRRANTWTRQLCRL
jgi:hypothetical protein